MPDNCLKQSFHLMSIYGNKECKRSGSRREMGRGVVASLDVMPFRCAALRNPGHGSRRLSTLELNRKAKPSVTVRRKATGLAAEGPLSFKSLASQVFPRRFISITLKRKGDSRNEKDKKNHKHSDTGSSLLLSSCFAGTGRGESQIFEVGRA